MAAEFSFRLFTDPHFFDGNSPEAKNEDFINYSKSSPRCVLESGKLLESLFEVIGKDDEVSTILIAGDLTHWGEKDSHIAFREQLRELQKAGKNIYLITATHDYGRTEQGGPAREELAEFYADFGFNDAIAVYERDGLSYVSQIAPGIRLLALNSDGNTREFRGLWPDQLEWAKEQIAAAHESGDYIFGMMHYPLLPGSPVMGLVRDAVVADWKNTASFLADAGLDLIFTGHMHLQSLNVFTSPNGNKITDVCTGALCSCPPAHRKITFTADGKADIRSYFITELDCDTQGKTVEKFTDDKFCGMINNKIDQMENDYEGFMRYLSNKEPDPKLKGFVNFAGRTIKKLTLNKLAHLFMFKADDSIIDVLFKDLLLNCVLNIFKGDEPYVKGTPEYAFFEKLFSRLKIPVKILEKKLSGKDPLLSDIPGFIYSLIGDTRQMDNNAVIDINRKGAGDDSL